MPSQTFTLTSNINVRFDGTGNNFRAEVTGTGSARVKFGLYWSDNPGVAGDAIGSVTVDGRTFNSPGENGSDVRDWIMTPGNYPISTSGQLNPAQVNGQIIRFFDNDGSDTNASFEIVNVVNQTYTITVTADLTVNPTTANGDGGGATCTTLTWNTNGATSVTIDGVGKGATGSEVRCPNISSNACGGPSPATRSWVLTACNGSNCVSDTKTFSLYSDNSPSNSWTTSFSNLDPGTQYTFTLGTLACIDRPTSGSAGNGASLNASTYGNGNTVTLTAYSAPFDTTIPASGTFGNTNSKTFPVTIGTSSFNVTFTTRAPRVAEDFNYGDVKNQFPYPEIDVAPGTPTQYLTTGGISMNDIDIPVELKMSDGNAQINVNGSGWKNVRQI